MKLKGAGHHRRVAIETPASASPPKASTTRATGADVVVAATTPAGGPVFVGVDAKRTDVDAIRAKRGSTLVPKGWHEISTRSVASAMKTLVDDNASITLRMKSGREIAVDPSDEIAELVKRGDLRLYKNEKDHSDVDAEGHKVWHSAYYLVATPKNAMLDEQLELLAKRPAPPVVDGPPLAREPQPNLYTSSLGQYAQLAQWIDMNVGNRDGVITVAELQQYIAQYGGDPRNHSGIIGIAMLLGVPTVQFGNQIQIANLQVQITVGGGGGGVSYVQQQRTPPAGNDAWSVATSLVHMTQGANRGDVDAAIRSLASLSPVVLGFLARRGTRVIVSSTITEYRPDLRFTQPRGWPPGSTWQQPAGMYDPNRNEIVLARGGTAASVVFHEVGHALDWGRGIARSPEATFMRMYQADLPLLHRNGEHYLVQPGEAGPSEAFAESHMWFQTRPDWLQRAYPNLHGYWSWVAQNGYREVGA